MTEREIYERIAKKGSCGGISCVGTLNFGYGCNDIPCPFRSQCDGSDKVVIAQAWLDAHKENKMEQKYGKVIFDPTSKEAEALKGKEVECSDSYDFTVNRNVGILEGFTGTRPSPFIIEDGSCMRSRTFIRAIEPPKEPTYRPFTDEEMKGLYGKTLFDPEGYPNTVTGYKSYGNEVEVCVGLSIRSSSALFEKYTLDGHKCGVLV